jgi:hypothetical protein
VATRLTQLDILSLLTILDNKPVEEHVAKKLVTRGLCYTEGPEVFVTIQGQNALKKAGVDHTKMKSGLQSLSSREKSYDPMEHLSDWTTDALEVRAAQTHDPRVMAEIERRLKKSK